MPFDRIITLNMSNPKVEKQLLYISKLIQNTNFTLEVPVRYTNRIMRLEYIVLYDPEDPKNKMKCKS